jgi:transcriptional regulator GlxA family with amidase domain
MPTNDLGKRSRPGTKGAKQQRRVVIIAAPPVRMLDVFGPAEVFTDANRLRGGEPMYEVEIVSATEDEIVASHVGIPLLTQGTYQALRSPVDTLLVAGSDDPNEIPYSPDFLDWLRKQSKKVRRLGSICTGALALAGANLLDGRRATTHWNWCNELSQRHPLVKLDAEPIYIRDQNVYTSAGVTAGIDLALALVEEDLGSSLALQIARMMVVFLRRPGGQSQFSATLAAQTSARQPLTDLVAWMADHINDDLSVAALAQRVAMSPRNFARIFTREVGETPGCHVESIRLEAARRLLETTYLNLEQVADKSGFKSGEILRRTFVRRLGVSPRQYRTTFGATYPH